MFFQVKFSMDNAAFTDDDPAREVARILGEVASRVERQPSGDVRDVNGNKVGSYGRIGTARGFEYPLKSLVSFNTTKGGSG